MNCPKCGAWSTVRETRSIRDGLFFRRGRECANGHRFPTYEVHAAQWDTLVRGEAVPRKRGPTGREL